MASATPKSYAGATTAATSMKSGAGTLVGLTINAAATAVVTLWDNASAASGTILFQKTFAAAANNYQLNFAPTGGLRFANGVTITVATATAQTTIALV